jgi:5,10-methylenetetrahydrofolate reductase
MLEEARTYDASPVFAGRSPLTLGVTSRLAPLPTWKRDADFVFVQAGFDLQALRRWSDSLIFGGRVYAGLLVVASLAMTKTLAEATGQMTIAGALLKALDTDPNASVDTACNLRADLRRGGGFDGVHLIPVGRYRQVAARLEHDGWGRGRS